MLLANDYHSHPHTHLSQFCNTAAILQQ